VEVPGAENELGDRASRSILALVVSLSGLGLISMLDICLGCE
jgi:hypothetical protein